MEFNIKLDDQQLRTVLKYLDAGQHGEVRPVIDNIIGQAQRQEVEAKAPAEPVVADAPAA